MGFNLNYKKNGRKTERVVNAFVILVVWVVVGIRLLGQFVFVVD